MEKLESAKKALENYKRLHHEDLQKRLRNIASSQEANNADLAIKTSIAQAILGTDKIYVIGSPENLLAAEILQVTPRRVQYYETLTGGFDVFLRSEVGKSRRKIMEDLKRLKNRESELLPRFKPNSLLDWLTKFEQEVWPDYLTPERTEKYPPACLNILHLDTQWEIAYTHPPDFRELRRSVDFEKAVKPIIGESEPTSTQYSLLGVTKAAIVQFGIVMRKLTALTLGTIPPKADVKSKPPQPLDLSQHPHALHWEPGMNGLQWPDSTIRAPKDDEGDGRHPAADV